MQSHPSLPTITPLFDDGPTPVSTAGIGVTPVVTRPTCPEWLSAFGLTHEGQRCKDNEDDFRIETLTDDLNLFAVADGMGGSSLGEVASGLAIQSLFTRFEIDLRAEPEPSAEEASDWLQRGVEEANAEVHEFREALGDKTGSTMCAALAVGREDLWVANVGDSRGYVLRGGKLIPLTTDHSIVAEMVREGMITRAEARTHPMSHMITRFLGGSPEVEVDLYHVAIQPGDVYLLCSDGLWGELTDEEITEVLVAEEDLPRACHVLISRANLAGGHDNVTVVLWRVSSGS